MSINAIPPKIDSKKHFETSATQGKALHDALNNKRKQQSRLQSSTAVMETNSQQFKKENEGVIKIITILFMSHRIQAKIYHSDTYQTFLFRLRKILPNI